MNIRNVEQPIKRKRGRPPKKQPPDVYTSFTSLFQTVSGSFSPDAESNSNVMVKLGEPDSCIPLMKVSQSSETKHRRRGKGVLASGGSKSLSTVLPSRSGSPSGSQLSLGTPLSTNANVPFQGSFRAVPDNQIENNDVYIYSSFMDMSSVSDKDMLSRVPNCQTESASEYETNMLSNIDEFAVKFDLHPQISSMMNSTMDINSSPEIKWPSATDMIPGNDVNADWNCRKENPSCIYMAINLNALPCSDICDARAALKRAFS